MSLWSQGQMYEAIEGRARGGSPLGPCEEYAVPITLEAYPTEQDTFGSVKVCRRHGVGTLTTFDLKVEAGSVTTGVALSFHELDRVARAMTFMLQQAYDEEHPNARAGFR